MITPKLIEEIIATYRRHGWRLQRVLLRAATRASIGERETVFTHRDGYYQPLPFAQDRDIDRSVGNGTPHARKKFVGSSDRDFVEVSDDVAHLDSEKISRTIGLDIVDLHAKCFGVEIFDLG